jgi:hypothetical protein
VFVKEEDIEVCVLLRNYPTLRVKFIGIKQGWLRPVPKIAVRVFIFMVKMVCMVIVVFMVIVVIKVVEKQSKVLVGGLMGG